MFSHLSRLFSATPFEALWPLLLLLYYALNLLISLHRLFCMVGIAVGIRILPKNKGTQNFL
jgi:hypothetical protein